jgi:hypothetical protein
MANPYGRKKVEEGDFCKRTNTHNVDINRNWGYHFGDFIELDEEFPGTKAFSEVETRFILDTIKQFAPHVYLSVHSGAFGLYHPYAYLKEELPNQKNLKVMKDGMNIIKDKYCTCCDVGGPYKFLKYQSSGTSADYVYDILKTPIAMIFEIWSNEMPFTNYVNRLVPPVRFKSVLRRSKKRAFLQRVDMVIMYFKSLENEKWTSYLTARA